MPPPISRRTERPTLVGRFAVVLLVMFGSMLPAVADAATSSDCVGVVVDRGNGTVRTACVAYTGNLTGQQVLQEAGVKLSFDSSGFICQLDGYPTTCKSDLSHYWSYYHRAAGAAVSAWTYSKQGAADYRVQPGETEGWRYVNGEQQPPLPEPVDYQQLVANLAAPTGTAPGSATAAGSGGNRGLAAGVIAGIVGVGLLIAGAGWQLARRRRTG